MTSTRFGPGSDWNFLHEPGEACKAGHAQGFQGTSFREELLLRVGRGLGQSWHLFQWRKENENFILSRQVPNPRSIIVTSRVALAKFFLTMKHCRAKARATLQMWRCGHTSTGIRLRGINMAYAGICQWGILFGKLFSRLRSRETVRSGAVVAECVNGPPHPSRRYSICSMQKHVLLVLRHGWSNNLFHFWPAAHSTLAVPDVGSRSVE